MNIGFATGSKRSDIVFNGIEISKIIRIVLREWWGRTDKLRPELLYIS